MQKCPKCGYDEGKNWPFVMVILAFGVVAVVAGISGGRYVQLSVGVGWVLFAAAMIWKSARDDKNQVEHSRAHSPVAGRPKQI